VDIVGDWDVTIKTPVGSLQIVYSFADRDGVITGSAAGRHETVQVTDIVVADQTDATQPRLRRARRRRRVHGTFAGGSVTAVGGVGRAPPLRGFRRRRLATTMSVFRQ
jgi:hypothetical protein